MTWLMEILKDLTRRTAPDKMLNDKVVNIANNPKYDGQVKQNFNMTQLMEILKD